MGEAYTVEDKNIALSSADIPFFETENVKMYRLKNGWWKKCPTGFP